MSGAVAEAGMVAFQLRKYDFSREGSMLREAALAKIPKRAHVDVQLSGPLGSQIRKMAFVRSVRGLLYLADVITGSLYELSDGWCATSELLTIQITPGLRRLAESLDPDNDIHF